MLQCIFVLCGCMDRMDGLSGKACILLAFLPFWSKTRIVWPDAGVIPWCMTEGINSVEEIQFRLSSVNGGITWFVNQNQKFDQKQTSRSTHTSRIASSLTSQQVPIMPVPLLWTHRLWILSLAERSSGSSTVWGRLSMHLGLFMWRDTMMPDAFCLASKTHSNSAAHNHLAFAHTHTIFARQRWTWRPISMEVSNTAADLPTRLSLQGDEITLLIQTTTSQTIKSVRLIDSSPPFRNSVYSEGSICSDPTDRTSSTSIHISTCSTPPTSPFFQSSSFISKNVRMPSCVFADIDSVTSLGPSIVHFTSSLFAFPRSRLPSSFSFDSLSEFECTNQQTNRVERQFNRKCIKSFRFTHSIDPSPSFPFIFHQMLSWIGRDVMPVRFHSLQWLI